VPYLGLHLFQMKTLRNKSLTWLMILSQALLLSFVVQWLISQYNNEKNELQKDLAAQFEKSQQEVLDTLLEKNLIYPLLNNKKGFKIELKDEEKDIAGNGMVKMFLSKKTNSDSTKVVTVISDSVRTTNHLPEELNDSTRNILLHGMKLIVREVSASTDSGLHLEQRIYSSGDTLLMKKHLDRHFKEKGWNFNVQFKNISSGDSVNDQPGKKLFYFRSSLFPKSFGLEIGSYHLYLFKKILPESVFAIILLLLTAFAFIVAHRALTKQVLLNEMKNDFVDNISHELKTPLSTVKVVIEALNDEKIRNDETKMKGYLEMATMEINRLELLTGKVLTTSMIENGIINIEKQKIDLKKIISELLNTLKIRFANDLAEVVLDIPDGNFIIEGDSLLIQGAVLNILDNSLKYSGVSPKITISLAKLHEQLFLKIADNGPGIPVEYREKVFEKFFRLPSGNLHNVKGHGLGLSYVAMVMKIHNGSVRVENGSESGCVFTLVFKNAEASL
jgi:signal transduction histidine kinase